MTALSIDALDIRKNEMLILAFHRPSNGWFAGVGPQDQDNYRAIGPTPIAAFGELLVDLGHRPAVTQ